ncbi:MAG: hypothetical protein ACRDD1_08285, partial [Planctomycetia bacterium]
MNPSRQRKIVYLLTIVVLFTGLLLLGRGIEATAVQNKLAAKSLGKINPVSGTANLVFFGFRGVAVTFLWYEFDQMKKKERWFEIRPILESITLLQPNFVGPWTFQAWNMAYNIAAEWESVADKYYWIREGIDYMKQATTTNADQPDMEWYVGWLYYNRFGMSDEKTYLRELFKKDPDDEFVRSEKSGIKDNFEKGYDYFEVANDTLRRLNAKPKQRGITPFMSYPAMCKTTYSDFRGKDGLFGETTREAWRTAYNEWIEFGQEGVLDRNEPKKYRLEFAPEEWDKLTDDQRHWSQHYAKIVNYYYWKKRTRREATDEMQAAREAFYKADEAFKKADYKTAIAQFEKGFPIWRKIMEDDDNLRNDSLFVEDSQDYEATYLRILSRLDEP